MSTRLTLAISLAALLSVPAAFSPVLAAEPAPSDTIDMSVAVGQSLSEIMELMGAGRLDEANAKMQQLRQQPLNDYEQLRVLQQAINLDITAGNYQQAIADHEELLQKPNLSAADRQATTIMLGKLQLQVEDWTRGIETLLPVNLAQGGSSMEIQYLIAFGYYRAQLPALALEYVQKAIATGGAKAGEAEYSLLGRLYVESRDYPNAITAYEKVFEAVPNPAQAESYYSTLAQLYLQNDDKDKGRAMLEKLIATYPNSAKVGEYKTRLASIK